MHNVQYTFTILEEEKLRLGNYFWKYLILIELFLKQILFFTICSILQLIIHNFEFPG